MVAVVAAGSLIGRKNAKLAGLSRYFTGRSCQDGHIVERYTSNGNCIMCARESDRTPASKAWAASYQALHAEARKEYWANYRAQHREEPPQRVADGDCASMLRR
jgi:hypothetical protein